MNNKITKRNINEITSNNETFKTTDVGSSLTTILNINMQTKLDKLIPPHTSPLQYIESIFNSTLFIFHSDLKYP